MKRYGKQMGNDPTPAQIKKYCNNLQAKWTDEERAKRGKHLICLPIEIKTASPVWSDLIQDQATLI